MCSAKNRIPRFWPKPEGICGMITTSCLRSSARLWEQLREYFEVRFRAEKYGVPYFLAESEAKQSDPRKEAVGARAPKAFGGRGFKWRAPSGVCRMGVGRLSHRWRLDPIVSQNPEIQCNAL